METHGDHVEPSRSEAEETLRTARLEERTTRQRPVPFWYYPLLAVLLFGTCALNGVDDGGVASTTIAIAVLIVAIGAIIGFLAGRYSFFPAGYSKIRVDKKWPLICAVIAAAFPISAMLTEDALGRWVWFAAGGVLATLILVLGLIYWNRSRSNG